MNRILNIDEVCQAGRGPIWYQQRFCRFAESVIYSAEHIPFFRFKVVTPLQRNWHIKADPGQYGKSWRCWEQKPTDEDLKQPFKEGGKAE